MTKPTVRKPDIFDELERAREKVEHATKYRYPIMPIEVSALDVIEICDEYEALLKELKRVKKAYAELQREVIQNG